MTVSPSIAPVTSAVPLADVQGLVLRGYGMNALRLFVLRVERAAEARRVLAELPITSATPWERKPDSCVNVAFTFAGLRALDLSPQTLASFPEEFRHGAAARATIVGDTGANAPEHWRTAFTSPDGHVLVTVFARHAAEREERSAALRRHWHGALREIAVQDGDMLPGKVAHFGYRDGFSQPAVEGGLPDPIPEPVPPAPTGEFLLGYQSQFSDFTYPVPQPSEFGLNGSFLAVRLLEQDCTAFESFLTEASQQHGIDRELLAAKLIGRWRNGVPLELSPENDHPTPEIAPERLNAYDYAKDPYGYRCPMGSHMRRNHPRALRIAGGGASNHRIMRRGLPYGPLYDPAHPNDGIERGLLGLFIAVNLKDQFEFLMSEWVNGTTFAAGLNGSKDPVLGNNADGSGTFTIPVQGGKPITISGFSSFVRTRGAAYGFLPSISALRSLATFP